MLKVGQELEVTVESMAVGGNGVARFQTMVLFIPLAAPGDELRVRVQKLKKNYAQAEIVEIIKASSQRVQPPCPYFGSCGGCSWQQLSASEQLRQKQNLVQASVRKHSGYKAAVCSEIVASPNEFRYRNRIQLHWDGTRKKLGYMARKSDQVVEIADCLLAEKSVVAQIEKTRQELLAKNSSQRIELRSQTETQDLNTFSQVNTLQNRNLIGAVEQLFLQNWKDDGGEIWDLYSGAGNFSFPLIRLLPTSTLHAVELDERAVLAANRKSASLGLQSRLQFHSSSVENWIEGKVCKINSALLLDPPRTGCAPKVAARLASLPFSFIVYISCHPTTLARDLNEFFKAGWLWGGLKAFDMFPQTDHVESLVWLARGKL